MAHYHCFFPYRLLFNVHIPFIFEAYSHFSFSVDDNDWIKMTVNTSACIPSKDGTAFIYLESKLTYDQLHDSDCVMLTVRAAGLRKLQDQPVRGLAASVSLSWPDCFAGGATLTDPECRMEQEGVPTEPSLLVSLPMCQNVTGEVLDTIDQLSYQ